MADIIYRSSITDRIAKFIVGCGILYGAYNLGSSVAEYKFNSIPYTIMKNKDAYYLVEKKTEAFRKIDESLFEKVSEK